MIKADIYVIIRDDQARGPIIVGVGQSEEQAWKEVCNRFRLKGVNMYYKTCPVCGTKLEEPHTEETWYCDWCDRYWDEDELVN